MAHHYLRVVRRAAPRFTLVIFVLGLLVVLSYGQATPCCNPPNYAPPAYTPPTSSPNDTWNPGSTSTPAPNPMTVDLVKAQSAYSPPNPYVSPTTQQTEWYVNNHPALSRLPWETRQQLINNTWQANSILNTPYLGSTPNPFYQNGQVIPNWYLPSTWSATINWQGVQPNGFVVSGYGTTYTTPYNPSFSSSFPYSNSRASAYNYSYQPNYIPPPPPPPRPDLRGVVGAPRPTDAPFQNLAHWTSLPGQRAADLRKALDDRERALAIHEAAGDKIAEAVDHAELARLYAQKDNVQQASNQLGIVDRMAGTIGDTKLQAHLIRDGADTNMLLGQFDDALNAYRKAMLLLRSADDYKGQAEVYASEGWVFQSLGNMPRALSCYDAALTLFDKLGDKEGAIRIRIGVGALYQSIGEFDRALLWYGKALVDASKEERARIQIRIAEMYLSRNSPIDALHRYEDALPSVQAGGDGTLEGTILAGMGRSYMAMESYRSAPETRGFLERALAKMKESHNRAGEAAVIASIGELNYWIAIATPTVDPKARFSEALKNYDAALRLMQDLGDAAGQVGVLTNLGLVYDAWGKYRKALEYYLQGLQKMDELQSAARIDEFRMDVAGQSAALYQRAIILQAALNHPAEAFNLSERARARNFLDQVGNRRISARLPTDFPQREEVLRRENISLQRRIAQEVAKPGPEIDQERIVSLESQRAGLQKQYANLMHDAKLRDPEYASFLSIAPLTLREVQAQLAPDETAVSYFTMPTATLVFVVTKNDFHLSTLAVTEAQIAWLIVTFMDFSGEDGIPPSLKELHKLLIAPIRSKVKTPRLAIVPYGLTHLVPFAALTRDGKRYLSDEFALFSLPSLSSLPYIRVRNTRSTNSAMVFANNQDEGFSYLGHAYDEAREVASLFNTEPILGDAARSTAFQNHAGDYDIIHLIAHFDHDRSNPQDARVILSHGKEGDGDLDLDQVLNLDLSKTSLVVLSGCQSQAGKWSRGDDIVGLSRAFIYAGSSSVIGSLWSVDDEATRTLMTTFYRNLRGGLGKAESLRNAQISTRQKYPHPYYWSGFVLTGDPGPSGASGSITN